MMNLAGAMVQGMIDGLFAGLKSIADAAADLGNKALSSIKKALGIHSPSKEFYAVGKYANMGLANGLYHYASLAANAASEVGTGAIENLKGTLSSLAGSINDTTDTTPTIRPVLDLSDVESGARKMNNMLQSTHNIDVSSTVNKTAGIASSIDDRGSGTTNNNQPKQGVSMSFVQNNYSPNALSRLDIYRQTKNQFSAVKGMVNG
jgi:hypothetical protein